MSSESEKKRAERRRQRELKNERKEELSGATSASERRKIKAKYSEPRANSNERRSEGNSYDSMSGRTEQPMPTMSEREEAAGLNLAGNNTLSGRGDPFYTFDREIPSEEITDQGVHDQTNDVLPVSQSAFSAVVCVNGKPHFASIQGEIGDEIT